MHFERSSPVCTRTPTETAAKSCSSLLSNSPVVKKQRMEVKINEGPAGKKETVEALSPCLATS